MMRRLRAIISWRAGRWCALVLLSLALAILFEALHVPAARMLGPLVAAIVLALWGANLRMARQPFVAAQGIVGCLMAMSIPASVASTFSRHWGALLFGVVAVTGMSYAVGWALARCKALPGDTAIWGASPGASSAMVILSQAYGADTRLVAFMQYLRVVCVSLSVPLVAYLWIHAGQAAAAAPPVAGTHLTLLPASWRDMGLALLVAWGGAAIGARLRIPAGALFVPLVAGILLQFGGHLRLELPPLVLAPAYAAIGWTVGSQFDRPAVASCLRALPAVLAGVLVLLLLCVGVAAVLVWGAEVDPLTAYLATSPGGADVIAIIAASTPVDLPFVITMQVLRMVFVLLAGPAIARAISARLGPASPS